MTKGPFPVLRLFTLALPLLAMGPVHGGTVNQYLTHDGRYKRAIDLNIGYLSTSPSGHDRVKGQLGGRFGLSYEFGRLPLNFAVIYSTKSFALGTDRITLSLVQAQLQYHRTLMPTFPYLEGAVFLSPNIAFDLNNKDGIPDNKALSRPLSADVGAALLANLSVFQARLYWSQNLRAQMSHPDITLSSFGVDWLIPLERRRVKK